MRLKRIYCEASREEAMLGVKIDEYCGKKARKWLKRSKVRSERRRAKMQPSNPAGYGKYSGYWA